MSGKTLSEQKSADLVEKALDKGEGIFELSSGVKLKTKDTINPSIIIDILSELESKRPEPPVVYIQAIDRDEVNLDDPRYIDRLQRWETVSAGRIADALILTGTEIEFIPEGIEKPEDDEWLEVLNALGFRLNRNSKPARYLAWVKHVAIIDQHDWEAITDNVGRQAGVTEADVKRAQGSFQTKDG